MSTDLTKLIERVADAGGPINLRDHDEWEAHLDGRRGLAVLWTPEELRPRTSAEALLIHAFKQEFEWRGWTWTARVKDGEFYEVIVWPRDVTSELDVVGRHVGHEAEVVAWCLAWLAAFEEQAA